MSAKIDTQSSERQAGTTPAALSRPRVGFSPTMLLNAAGTRPEPAVSVPSANAPARRRPRPPNPNSSRPGCTPGRTGCAGCHTASGCRPDRWRTGRGWSCRQQARRPRAVVRRPGRIRPAVGEAGTGRGRRQAGDIDIVLDREREPEEGQDIGADRGGALFKRSGRRQQPIRVNQRYPDAIVAARGDAGQHLARNFGRPHLAAPVALAHRCKVETQHSWRLPSPGMACSGWPLEMQDAFRLPAKGAACRGCGRPHLTPALVDSALTRGIAGQCPHLSGWHAACCAPRARESSTGER